MSRSNDLPLLVVLLFVLCTPAHALDTDFIVYDGHRSYAEGFRHAWSVDLMDEYMGLWPNSHTLASISIPVLGRPQEGLLVGMSVANAYPEESARTGTGLRTLDNSPGNWPNTMLFASLPLERISPKFGEGAYRDMDATLKASILSFAIVDNIRIHTLTLGLGLCKQVRGRWSSRETGVRGRGRRRDPGISSWFRRADGGI